MIKYDKRHTKKPHTEKQWEKFIHDSKYWTTDTIAYWYNVSKKTVYNWRWEYKRKKGKKND